jgi:predicted dehydrogenase
LEASSSARLGVGVIGLGRLWEARHKPALARLTDRFRISAIYDQVARRAALEASQLGCAVAGGLTTLIERPDVDVIYLLTPQWFGVHPIGLACAHRKPIYCAVPLADDVEGLSEVAAAVRSSGTPFMPELARRFYPATLRLRELLATSLGRPRLVLGHGRLFGFDRYSQPGPTTQLAPMAMAIDPGSYLLDWCRFVFQTNPTTLQSFGSAILSPLDSGNDFEGFVLEFPGGGLAQITYGRYHRSAWGEANRFLPQPGFQVFAERGAAWLEMPDRIQWSDARGVHEERLPLEPSVGEVLNDQFYRLVRRDHSLAPTLDDVLIASQLVQALRQSQREGRKVPFSAEGALSNPASFREQGVGPTEVGPEPIRE